MMMGLSLCSPMVVSTSSVKSLPAPASPMSTVGFTCKQDCREAHDPQPCERRLQDDLTEGLAVSVCDAPCMRAQIHGSLKGP